MFHGRKKEIQGMTPEKFRKIPPGQQKKLEGRICDEIYGGNSEFYPLIPYLTTIDRPFLGSSGHMEKLPEENRVRLYTYCYVSSPNREELAYIGAYLRRHPLEAGLLDEVLGHYPDCQGILLLKQSLNSSHREEKPTREGYFRIKSGLTIKLNHEDCTCYVLDPKQKEWRMDAELYGEISQGSVQMERIHMEDTYPVGEPLDWRRGKVL